MQADHGDAPAGRGLDRPLQALRVGKDGNAVRLQRDRLVETGHPVGRAALAVDHAELPAQVLGRLLHVQAVLPGNVVLLVAGEVDDRHALGRRGRGGRALPLRLRAGVALDRRGGVGHGVRAGGARRQACGDDKGRNRSALRACCPPLHDPILPAGAASRAPLTPLARSAALRPRSSEFVYRRNPRSGRLDAVRPGLSVVQRPLKTGLRFSTKASCASRVSSSLASCRDRLL